VSTGTCEQFVVDAVETQISNTNTGMTNRRQWPHRSASTIGPHQTCTEHLDLELARLVGRLGSGVQVRASFHGSLWHFWSANKSLWVLCGHFEVHVLSCSPLWSDVAISHTHTNTPSGPKHHVSTLLGSKWVQS